MFLKEVSLFQVGWMFTPAEHKLMTEWCDATTRAAAPLVCGGVGGEVGSGCSAAQEPQLTRWALLAV